MEPTWPFEIIVDTIEEMCEVLCRLRFSSEFAASCQKRGSGWVIRVRPVSA